MHGIRPKNSITGRLKDWKLAFTNRGYELTEPRFADIERLTLSGDLPVNGVAHEISNDEMIKLDQFEGVGTSYDRITVSFKSDTTSLEFPVQTYTSLSASKLSPGLPSKRYAQLLVNGAKTNGLNPTYCKQMLEKIPVFDCAGTTMPAVPVDAQVVSQQELARHSFKKTMSKEAITLGCGVAAWHCCWPPA